jgi:hypothetical protein
MSDTRSNIDVKGIGAITLWVALFWGTPDLHDALIHWLMQ